jgi:hypothetical protein
MGTYVTEEYESDEANEEDEKTDTPFWPSIEKKLSEIRIV